MRAVRPRVVATVAVVATALPLAAASTSHASVTQVPRAVAPASCPPPVTGVRTHAPGAGKTVALTFDDGPGPSTAATLAVLRKYAVRATFFDVGEHVQANPELARETAAEGHLVGNHTWDHPHLAGRPAAEQGAEMDAGSAAQLAVLGSLPCVFRPPYGNYDDNTVAEANARGMSMWTWSISTQDWMAEGSPSSTWVARIIARAEAGVHQSHPVILMHNGPAPGDPPAADAGDPATVKALPTIIAFYRKHGYQFVDLLGRRGYTPDAPNGAPAPAAATTAAGMHVFVRTTDGSITEKTLAHGRWSTPQPLGGRTTFGPAVARTATSSMLLAITDAAGHVRVRSIGDRGVGGWTSIGGTSTARPAIAVDPRTATVTVVVRNGDGTLSMRQRVHGQWRAWSNLGGAFVTAPAVAATPDGRVTVAAATGDGVVWVRNHQRWWAPWHALSTRTSADPAITAAADGRHLVLVVRTTTGSLHRRVGTADAATWTAEKSLAGVSVSGPAVTTRSGVVHVLAVSTADQVIDAHARDTSRLLSWTAWSRLPLDCY